MSTLPATPAIDTETPQGELDATLDLMARLDTSDRFAKMKLRRVPVLGPGAPRISPQVRPAQAHALTREGVDDLVKSIGLIGQLQPVIVEELPDGSLHLLVGQRRMHALEFGNAEEIESPHYDGQMSALVVPGPLGQWERWAVQMAENIARKDLTATDQGRALWMARCTLLTERIREAGHEPPEEVLAVENPADRCVAIFEWKAGVEGLGTTGANWVDTAAALGLDLSEPMCKSKAKQFRDLGEELSARLDESGASHRARKATVDVAAMGGQGAADEILEAIGMFGEDTDSRMLEEAMMLRKEHPELEADEVARQVAAERGIAAKLEPSEPIGPVERDEIEEDDDEIEEADPVDCDALIRRLRDIDNDLAQKVEPHLRTAAGEVANGAPVGPRDASTLLLMADNLEAFAGRIRALGQCED